MKIVEPKTHFWTRISINKKAVQEYLDDIGVTDFNVYAKDETSDEELLIELMGRLCYKSWQPSLNPNVTRIREDSEEYLENLLRSKHGSVLEHVQLTFAFENISRVFTHELVRHRVGTAFSQESMRYVRLTDIPIWIPPSLSDNLPQEESREFEDDIYQVIALMESFQDKWSKRFELDESKSFDHKKRITSSLRRFFTPTGVATHIGFSCNIRELRHVIQMRTSVSAEEEMRLVFTEVADEMIYQYPFLFADLKANEKGEFISSFEHPEIHMSESIYAVIKMIEEKGSDTDLDMIKRDLKYIAEEVK